MKSSNSSKSRNKTAETFRPFLEMSPLGVRKHDNRSSNICQDQPGRKEGGRFQIYDSESGRLQDTQNPSLSIKLRFSSEGQILLSVMMPLSLTFLWKGAEPRGAGHSSGIYESKKFPAAAAPLISSSPDLHGDLLGVRERWNRRKNHQRCTLTLCPKHCCLILVLYLRDLGSATL